MVQLNVCTRMYRAERVGGTQVLHEGEFIVICAPWC